MHPNTSSADLDGHNETSSVAVLGPAPVEVSQAIELARAAQPGWWSLPPNSRSRRMFRAAVNLAAVRTQLVDLLASLSHQRAAADAEFEQALATVERWAIWTRKLGNVFGAVAPVAATTLLAEFPQPAGIVVVAHRSTGPLDSFVGAVAPLIAGGNAVVLVVDPADAPLISFAGHALTRSGVFDGIVNVVVGDKLQTVLSLIEHVDVGGYELSGLTDDDRAQVMAAAAGHDDAIVTEAGASGLRARSALAFLDLCDWPRGVASAPMQRAPQPAADLRRTGLPVALSVVAEVREAR